MDSPSRTLYDDRYYDECCEGFDGNSPRLANYDWWVAPHLNGHVLELGHGRGEITLKLLAHPQVTHVTAIDYSYDATNYMMKKLNQSIRSGQLTKTNADKLTIINHDLTKENIFSGPYSAVVAFDVVEHIHQPHLTKIMQQLSNHVQMGAKFYAITPLSNETPNERHVWLARKPEDFFNLAPGWSGKYIKWSGSGEDHLFELVKS